MLQTDSDGIQTEVEGATSASYTLALGDIGSHISVSCEPVRNDGACGPVVISEHLGPILPGMLIFFFFSKPFIKMLLVGFLANSIIQYSLTNVSALVLDLFQLLEII